MGEGIEKKVRDTDEEEDLFDNLPDVLLTSIISRLPGTKAARTSVLSHRWKTLWKYSSHLNFDQREMLKSLIKVYIETFDPNERLIMARHRSKISLKVSAFLDPIAKAALLIESIMDNHIGPLRSCSIIHLPESCASEDVVRWMKKLLEKGVGKVSMELESPDLQTNDIPLRIISDFLDIPFDVFISFKVLELKNYRFTTTPFPNPHQILKTLTLNNVCVGSNNFEGILSHCLSLENLTLQKCHFLGAGVKIDSPNLKYFKLFDMIVHKMLIFATNIEIIEIGSIICNHEDLVFETPKLHVLRTYNDVENLGRHLATRDIIEICGGILVRQGSSMRSIFDNLVILCLDLDFTNNRNLIALSFAIKSCHQLKNLQINNQVNMDYNGGTIDHNDNACLPYAGILFWQKREPCGCVTYQLKSLCIKGYTGGEFENEFVKYLILNGGVIENITIRFLDDCSWSEVVATNCLLSYPKLSPKLSFDLKPGAKYARKYGDSFKKWVTTLR